MNLLRRWLPDRRWGVIAPPFLWLSLFFVIPFALVFKISLSEMAIAQPPYVPLLEYLDGVLNVRLNFGNYTWLFDDPLYADAYLSSLGIAAWSTVICLAIGYPMAYAISKMRGSLQNLCLLLVVLPSWTSLLIRVYAWMGILKNDGIINNVLLAVGLIAEPLRLLNTTGAVYVGIVYAYLPFMVLPLYANLTRMDPRLLEAAADLGARPLTRFLRITLPLSVGGVIAGSMLVFIPAVGEFVVPELLGGNEATMIGKVLWGEFFANRDWPVASAVATLMLLVLILPILLFHRYQSRELEVAR